MKKSILFALILVSVRSFAADVIEPIYDSGYVYSVWASIRTMDERAAERAAQLNAQGFSQVKCRSFPDIPKGNKIKCTGVWPARSNNDELAASEATKNIIAAFAEDAKNLGSPHGYAYFSEAEAKCKSMNMRLPTLREAAEALEYQGYFEIRESEFAGESVGTAAVQKESLRNKSQGFVMITSAPQHHSPVESIQFYVKRLRRKAAIEHTRSFWTSTPIVLDGDTGNAAVFSSSEIRSGGGIAGPNEKAPTARFGVVCVR